MTINDLVAQSVGFQGKTRVSSFDGDGNETVHFEGMADIEWTGAFLNESEWPEKEITYIFAIGDTLHIEIEGE